MMAWHHKSHERVVLPCLAQSVMSAQRLREVFEAKSPICQIQLVWLSLRAGETFKQRPQNFNWE